MNKVIYINQDTNKELSEQEYVSSVLNGQISAVKVNV